jgi:SAM-dependent methyltransferase
VEIGCGDGGLAELLQADGHRVTALDSDEKCVAASQARGVDARLAHWPSFEDGVFEAVLFTRSLHHMELLDESVRAAFACLTPGGRLIVEDFAHEFSHEVTRLWFRGLTRILAAAGLSLDRSKLLQDVASERPLAEAWQADHEHDLHPSSAIEAALRQADAGIGVETAAYFFRYLAAVIDDQALLDRLLEHERDLIGSERIEALGRRFVATKG